MGWETAPVEIPRMMQVREIDRPEKPEPNGKSSSESLSTCVAPLKTELDCSSLSHTLRDDRKQATSLRGGAWVRCLAHPETPQPECRPQLALLDTMDGKIPGCHCCAA